MYGIYINSISYRSQSCLSESTAPAASSTTRRVIPWATLTTVPGDYSDFGCYCASPWVNPDSSCGSEPPRAFPAWWE